MGTKSILWGAHCWCVHPLFVAAAWTKLYGFPTDPRLWLCFYCHDLGYWGKSEMDNADGENHVLFGAEVMGLLFDKDPKLRDCNHWSGPNGTLVCPCEYWNRWRRLCKYHSRFWCKKHQARPSNLCFADKLAIALTPWWIYLPMTRVSGELAYYMRLATSKYAGMQLNTVTPRSWYASMQAYLKAWVAVHKDGSTEDTWTPGGTDDK